MKRTFAAVLLASGVALAEAPETPSERAQRDALYNPSSNASLVLRATYLYPDSLALQNANFPGSVTNDRKIGIGGIFSGLFKDPRDPFLTFWAITDRGPNGEISVGGSNRRTFPVPEFDPAILFVRVQAGADSPAELKIYEPKYLRTTAGQPVTGLPNRPNVDETPYDYTATTPLAFNMDGLDTEGLVRAPDGDFWICEEYGPSVLRVGFDGIVKMRYVPQGSGITSRGYPVSETLPAVYAKRRSNRGFESLAISKDGTTLYTIIQSPLRNPDAATGNASRIIRVLALSTATGMPTAEYVFVTETIQSFGETNQADMKISETVWVNRTTLLVDERTDKIARIYAIDLASATNVLGTKWDDPAQRPTLEALTPADLATNAIVPARKTLVVDINQVVGTKTPEKIEGLAIQDPWTIVVGNDNDFDILQGFDAAGNLKPTGALCELLFIRLSQPLALEAP